MKNEWIYKGTKIYVDDDENIGYEKSRLLRKLLNIILVPILNSLSSSHDFLAKKSHPGANIVIEKATSHEALEVLYNSGYAHLSTNFLEHFAHKLWFGTNNSMAARNRLRLVKRELRKIILELLKRKERINLLSIASGSARAIIETIEKIKIPEGYDISLSFLDKNPDAIEYSKTLAKSCSSKLKTRWILDTASQFPKYLADHEKINIVEMVGLLDYFDDTQVVKVLSIIYNNLTNGGTMIIANINDNSERKFVTNLVGWPMVYRKAEKLIFLATKSGFRSEKIFSIYEPLKIHHVLIARK